MLAQSLTAEHCVCAQSVEQVPKKPQSFKLRDLYKDPTQYTLCTRAGISTSRDILILNLRTHTPGCPWHPMPLYHREATRSSRSCIGETLNPTVSSFNTSPRTAYTLATIRNPSRKPFHYPSKQVFHHLSKPQSLGACKRGIGNPGP